MLGSKLLANLGPIFKKQDTKLAFALAKQDGVAIRGALKQRGGVLADNYNRLSAMGDTPEGRSAIWAQVKGPLMQGAVRGAAFGAMGGMALESFRSGMAGTTPSSDSLTRAAIGGATRGAVLGAPGNLLWKMSSPAQQIQAAKAMATAAPAAATTAVAAARPGMMSRVRSAASNSYSAGLKAFNSTSAARGIHVRNSWDAAANTPSAAARARAVQRSTQQAAAQRSAANIGASLADPTGGITDQLFSRYG